ncbi:uncharacterized protein PHALS_07605 [Plasmopara halstedii]|uniref:Protein FAR1-RELATED SEQUENCE n=1 Tax=Plasmopara halstedii TaxID=4781 RepID=A0A0P1B5Z3_PLAHL|nr:uncharacterized protein PHALS_07605 [Plasmopara halstedii]CEG49865.1 hypothetical protein PHALS_07605 [Plasmopara halstedii]|eukprot:XP_024586234.1 hypothetical protein PHALS_07605 [Plasmopara halstedii]
MGALDEMMAGSANILCTWHINKNVLAKCKRMFSSGEEWDEFISQWNCLISSSSVDEYERQWKKFCTQFQHQPNALDYLSSTWLIHKERFINAWTSKHMHFGNTSTLRVEGSHAYIKTGASVFAAVSEKISVFALEIALKEFEKAQEKMDDQDTTTAWDALGKQLLFLPDVRQKVVLAQASRLIAGHGTVVELQPQNNKRGRGRPPGAKNLPKSSTKRNPSSFEIAEKEVGQKEQRSAPTTGAEISSLSYEDHRCRSRRKLRI